MWIPQMFIQPFSFLILLNKNDLDSVIIRNHYYNMVQSYKNLMRK